VGHVARTGEMRNAYSILAGITERKRPLVKSRPRWEDNIRIHLGETIGRRELDASTSEYGKVAGSCEHGNEPSSFIHSGEIFQYLR